MSLGVKATGAEGGPLDNSQQPAEAGEETSKTGAEGHTDLPDARIDFQDPFLGDSKGGKPTQLAGPASPSLAPKIGLDRSNAPFFHSHALCESPHIGARTRVWAFAHILPKAVIGENCNICDYVFIENDVVIGNNVTIKGGAQLWDGLRVSDNVFIGPNATFTNDKFPRSKHYQQTIPITSIQTGASIGANATILPGVVIGANAMVRAGAVVLRSVPDNAIVAGNPAKIIGYVGTENSPVNKTDPLSRAAGISGCKVAGVTLHHMKVVDDIRGLLTVGEFERQIPFIPRRYFMVFGVPSAEVRGEHAHYSCQQFLVCVRGACSVLVDD